MAKTKQELEQIKNEYIELQNKLKELNEEELKEVTGGFLGSVNNDEIRTRGEDHNVML